MGDSCSAADARPLVQQASSTTVSQQFRAGLDGTALVKDVARDYTDHATDCISTCLPIRRIVGYGRPHVCTCRP